MHDILSIKIQRFLKLFKTLFVHRVMFSNELPIIISVKTHYNEINTCVFLFAFYLKYDMQNLARI